MLANAGTPLLWFGLFYLTLANVLLGLFEGAAIAGAWRMSPVRSVLGMMAANFASSWAGSLLVQGMASAAITIASLHAWFWCCLGALFVLTLAVEYPFVRWVLAPRRGTSRQAARTTVRVNAVSYPLLLALGWWWCDWSVLSDWTVVPAAKLAPPGAYVVFYRDAKDARIWRRDLVAGGDAVVGEIAVTPGEGDLFLQPEADGVCLRVWRAGGASETVVANLPGLTAPMLPLTQKWDPFTTPSLAPGSPWRFTVGYDALICSGPGRRRLLSAATPLTESWWPRGATHLADDVALVTVGNQICLVKASTGEIALITHGRGATIAGLRR